MGIMKNEIPILEYDDSTRSVIMPDHEKLEITLPKKALFILIFCVCLSLFCTYYMLYL